CGRLLAPHCPWMSVPSAPIHGTSTTTAGEITHESRSRTAALTTRSCRTRRRAGEDGPPRRTSAPARRLRADTNRAGRRQRSAGSFADCVGGLEHPGLTFRVGDRRGAPARGPGPVAAAVRGGCQAIDGAAARIGHPGAPPIQLGGFAVGGDGTPRAAAATA